MASLATQLWLQKSERAKNSNLVFLQVWFRGNNMPDKMGLHAFSIYLFIFLFWLEAVKLPGNHQRVALMVAWLLKLLRCFTILTNTPCEY